MSETFELVVTFDDASASRRSQAAAELRDALEQKITSDASVQIEKDDPRTQDAGQTLVLLFGSGAAVAIAQGLKAYLAKLGSSISVKTREGEVVIRGDAAQKMDVAAIVAELRKRPKK